MSSKKEVELAAKVVAWLEGNGFDVYQEVSSLVNNKTADIVVKLPDRLSWVIEVKTSLSWDVFRQAHEWRCFANYISVAVPGARSKGRNFAGHILEQYGIGLIEVYDRNVYESKQAKFDRSPRRRLADSLVPEQKTYGKAGNANGDSFTPYKRTCMNLRNYVSQHPGCFFADAIKRIDTHYFSFTGARSAMSFWLKQDKVKGVKLVKEGRRLKLYLDDNRNTGERP